MQIKNKTRFLKELAKIVETPWEFIEAIASLEGLNMAQVAEKAGVSSQQYHTSKNQKCMGIKVALKYSNAFEIDPNILNRILADYNLKKVLCIK